MAPLKPIGRRGFPMRFASSLFAALCGLLACAALSGGAEARVRVNVDLASQTMYVNSAEGSYAWPISSARSGYSTPRGVYHVQRMEAMHRSHKYHNSPMPHSIFFSGGYAIHGTYEIAALGAPASHGCIRLSPQHAAALFQMVKHEGADIAINGSAPASNRAYASRARHSTVAYAARSRDTDGSEQADDGGFYLSPPMAYAPQPRGLGEWLLDPAGW
jgi:hypothetical protein